MGVVSGWLVGFGSGLLLLVVVAVVVGADRELGSGSVVKEEEVGGLGLLADAALGVEGPSSSSESSSQAISSSSLVLVVTPVGSKR